ncbi:DUF4352 domain-containing protein [Paractinoplanes toevensis]|uniref:DUF4352 domain-containing protein n=1 Tax=Paractinoplanes toevensis TaxID=571911 RepID=A0A919TGY8_9ACTN|nr:DUF4352 domain-containing protein [Actinoplanes toevensis]GIM95483.1 hypothetical protein Ato02nite_072760 [Actinoplanes toevensis]
MSQDRQTQRRAPLNPLLAVLFACGAVAVLFLAGLAAHRYGGQEPAAATATAAGAKPKATPSRKPPPGVGDAVRDGKFEFVVSRVDCSRSKVGLEHLERTAKGKYCVVSLSVRNIADGSQYFLGRAQKAFDAAGTEFGNDEIAGVYANHDTQTFLQKLDPGERVAGKLVFDVPEQVELTRLELHDSLLSGGVKVTVAT